MIKFNISFWDKQYYKFLGQMVFYDSSTLASI